MRRLKLSADMGLLAPFFMAMGVLFAIPLCIVVLYSFLESGAYGGVVWKFSLEAYRQFFYEKDFDGSYIFNTGYLQIFWRSIKLAGICTLLCLLAGFPVAYYMATRKPEQRNVWILLVTIPFWTNLLIRTYAWMLILRNDGIANRALQFLGITDAPVSLLYTDFAIGLGLLYSYLPFMILPIYANLERMDWRLTEAAADLYASRWQTLFRVVVPLAMPGILSGCVLVFIPAIGAFLAPDLLGGGKQLMIGNLIQMQFGFSRNWPFGSAASVILMVLVMLALMLMARKGRGVNSLL